LVVDFDGAERIGDLELWFRSRRTTHGVREGTARCKYDHDQQSRHYSRCPPDVKELGRNYGRPRGPVLEMGTHVKAPLSEKMCEEYPALTFSAGGGPLVEFVPVIRVRGATMQPGRQLERRACPGGKNRRKFPPCHDIEHDRKFDRIAVRS
jgi:hypothetical protein